jgi:Domain of unknown function (DU1801)
MSSFDQYLATLPEPERAELERIRQLVRRAVPEAEEATSYGMPAFKYKKRPLLGLRASKNHLSVFPFLLPGGRWPGPPGCGSAAGGGPSSAFQPIAWDGHHRARPLRGRGRQRPLARPRAQPAPAQEADGDPRE